MPRSVIPTIQPLDTNEARPFWSVMIPAYNRTTYLERTLRSVLEQAPAPEKMQIEVVDNASTEPGVEELVCRLNEEAGGERVSFFRNERNLGMAGNWNRCIERARGQWVHILHDDDMVREGFYKTLEEMAHSHPDAGLIFSRSLEVDERGEWLRLLPGPLGVNLSGVLEDAALRIVSEAAGQFVRCPAVAVRREAYEKVGGFLSDLPLAADIEMWGRVAASWPTGYVHPPLALYRVHARSATDDLLLRRNLLADVEHALNLVVSRLPPGTRAAALEARDKSCAITAIAFHAHLTSQGQHSSALRYALRALRFGRSGGLARIASAIVLSLLRLAKQKVVEGKR
jgi:GT2 family glycosyltransferase